MCDYSLAKRTTCQFLFVKTAFILTCIVLVMPAKIALHSELSPTSEQQNCTPPLGGGDVIAENSLKEESR